MPAEDKDRNVKKLRDETPVELESQFVLRLPPTPAASLRAAVRSGVMNIRERLSIQLETDMRHGTVRFDKWVMPAKVVDLPCIIESHKTLDRKTFYKTADICQMMICKEEDDGHKTTDEEESPTKKKAALDKKDNKDKKYQWPHGITPPLKNVRKRRFRKTLKKKYVDFPEIEKEVKRLFRMDNEAISVKYEVVNADDEKNEGKMNSLESSNGNMVFVTPGVGGLLNSNSQSLDVAEHDIFGEVVSSSDEDDVNIVDSGDEEGSQMSAVNSDMPTNQEDRLVTEFPKGMLEGSSGGYNLSSAPTANNASSQPSSSQEQESATKAITSSHLSSQNAEDSLDQMLGEHDKSEQENSVLLSRLAELEQEIASIQARRQAQELEVVNIENLALKQRFQNIIDNLKEEEAEKQRQYDDIVLLLNQC